eukprot:746706-Hanusia_phi.AAC.1
MRGIDHHGIRGGTLASYLPRTIPKTCTWQFSTSSADVCESKKSGAVMSCFEQDSNEAEKNYDLYKVLGVSKSSELHAIKGAYIKKAALWHPDRNAHTPTLARKKFQQVQNAFTILSNEETRRMYDRGEFKYVADLLKQKDTGRNTGY